MSDAATGRFSQMVAKYRADHQHPVNHFLKEIL